jgi:hypothetical protein
MSQEITEAFVQQYNSNVYHLAQQKGSKLRGAVRSESQQSKAQFWDRIGTVAAQKKVGRHGNTPQMDTPHSRRMLTLEDFEWADLVDDQDKIRLLISPESEYAMAAMWAFGRSMDDVIIEAAAGTAYAGEKGQTSVALPDAQKFAANNGVAMTNLNLNTLRKVKKMFDANEVPDDKRNFAITSSQLESLLGQTEIISSEYASVKALVNGDVDSFLGFKFHRLERLLTQSAALNGDPTNGAVNSGATSLVGFRKCLAWYGDGIILGIGKDSTSKIGERADKSYAMQVYNCMSIGATRMEEAKVVEVYCKES